MTSIIVAFPKLDDARAIRGLLMKHGFSVQGVAGHAAAVISMANELDYGIVVCGYQFPDMIYHELHAYLPEGFQMLLVASKRILDQCQGEGIMSLPMPVRAHELLQTMAVLADRMEYKRRCTKSKPRERSGEEKLLLNRAKAVLMERNNLTEEEAHRYIQKNSMDHGRSLVETAQMLLSML